MKTKNTYIYPIDKDSIDRITYNESPAHIGNLINSVDFIVAEGVTVKAAAGGVVVETKADSDLGGPDKSFEEYGNYIEIEHDNNEYSEYEHLRKDGVLVKVGERVKKGQVIGYSGNTGWMAHLGPHLHFMVGTYTENDDYQTLEIVWEE